MIRRWRPSLRMARREVLRHKTRTLLSVILIMVPVLVATVVALYAHNLHREGERQAREVMGGADALVRITPYTKTKVDYDYAWMSSRPGETVRGSDGKKQPARRPVTDVDLPSLLPDHTRMVPVPTSRLTPLPSGGTAHLEFLDGDDPLVEGLFPGIDGNAPDGADEAAIGRSMAEELGLLEDGELQSDASMTLADGTVLQVVGILKPDTWTGPETEAAVVVSPLNSAAPKAPREWLVDLDPLGTEDTRALVRTLADHGVAMMPRDAVLRPTVWHADQSEPLPVDYQALAIGALVILVGLIEVVLVVGAAFAVGARRQVRDLGLLAASGGAPSDIRRSLLAQGCVLGIGGSVLGVVAGTGTFLASIPAYEAIRHDRVWTDDLSIAALLGIAALGSVTGVAAALVPAWSISRLTPVAALAGRFPVRGGESTAHRGAFVLSGLGIVVLTLAGFWMSSAFSTSNANADQLSLPVTLAGLGFLMLVVGVVWMSPYAVRRIATLGRLLPLSGRYSFRDAARHRFRTAAAAIALTITVAATVLVGFGVTAANAAQRAEGSMPPHSLMVYQYGGTADRYGAIRDTVERIVGPVEMYSRSGVRTPKGRAVEMALSVGRGAFGSVGVVDEKTLGYFVPAEDLDRALATYRTGGIVTAAGAEIKDGKARIRLYGRGPAKRWELPAESTPSIRHFSDFPQAWISPETARAHGLRPVFAQAVLLTGRSVTDDDLSRLAVNGIAAWSEDPRHIAQRWVSLGAVGAAGLVTALVAGIAVALAAAEGRADVATLAAVGASPRSRRLFGAGHGLFLGLVGGLLGLVIGVPGGLSFGQLDGLRGVAVPWSTLAGTLLVVPLLAAIAGWVVTPTRLSLVRRTD